MNTDELIQEYPFLYHMAEAKSWPNIKKLGLLSTTASLDLFGKNHEERKKIESQWRPENVTLEHTKYGKIVIRDQKPLREKTLKKLVDGMTSTEFYELLNRKTFFWVGTERLKRLLKAKSYRGKTHEVLTIDAKKMVKKYENKIWLSRINSGAASHGVGRRGVYTFKQISDYPFEEIKKKQKEGVVELAVDYAVKDIAKYTIRVEEWKGDKQGRVIWEK